MTNKKRNALLLINALIWAGIIFAPFWFTDALEPYTRTQVVLFPIIGWFAINLLLTGGTASIRLDWVYIKRWFGNSSGKM